MIVPKVETDHL